MKTRRTQRTSVEGLFSNKCNTEDCRSLGMWFLFRAFFALLSCLCLVTCAQLASPRRARMLKAECNMQLHLLVRTTIVLCCLECSSPFQLLNVPLADVAAICPYPRLHLFIVVRHQKDAGKRTRTQQRLRWRTRTSLQHFQSTTSTSSCGTAIASG